MGAPSDFERGEILYRIGTFFLLVGMGLLVFFLLSEAAQRVVLGYFCGSLLFLIVGIIFRSRARRVVKPSERFSLMRRLMPKSKKDQGKK